MLACAAYVALTILWPMPGPAWLRLGLIVLFFCSAEAISLVRYFLCSRPDLPFQALRFFGLTSGMFMLLVGFGLLRDLLWLLAGLAVNLGWIRLDPGILRAGNVNLALVLICAGLAVFGLYRAYRFPILDKLIVTDANLPPALDRLSLLHATDLHIGAVRNPHWAAKCVQIINSSQADLVLISGDLADGLPERMRERIAPLAGLQAKYGVFACLGNHEYYTGAQEWAKAWQALGIEILVNDCRLLQIREQPLLVAGLADDCAPKYGQPGPAPEAISAAAQGNYTLLLCHRPVLARQHAALGYNFQFSGHTHGGQFPIMFPVVLGLNSCFRKGLYRCNQMWLHVGQGAGFWGYVPMRLWTRPEFTQIILRRT